MGQETIIEMQGYNDALFLMLNMFISSGSKQSRIHFSYRCVRLYIL